MKRLLAAAVTVLAMIVAIGLVLEGPHEVPEPPPAPVLETSTVEDPAPALPEYQPPPSTRTGGADEEDDLPGLGGIEPSRLAVRVVDPDGAPVPKAVLRVEHGSGEGAEEELLWVESGRAEVERKRPKEVLHLVVEKAVDQSGAPLGLLPRRLSNVPPDTEEVVIALPRSRRLRGVAVDDGGRPVSGVAIRAVPRGRASDAVSTHAGEDGTFEVLGLPEGAAEIQVPVDEPWLLLPVPVAPGEEHVRLVLVARAALRIEIRADDGSLVPRMRVRVAWEFERIPFSWSGETDAEGSVEVPGVPVTSRFEILTRGVVEGRDLPDVSLRDREYGTGTIRVRLPPTVRVSGLVVDGRGDPVARGSWELFGAEKDLLRVRRSGHFDDGRLRIENLAPGRYRLRIASVHGFAPRRSIQVEAPSDDVRVVLLPAVAASGRVLGKDPKDVVVQWFSPSTWGFLAEVDDEGRWEMARLPDQPGSLFAWRKGTHDVFLLEDARPTDRAFEIRLEPGLPVAGRIDGYAHDPNHLVHASLVRGPLRIPLRVGPDGAFERRGVPAGAWRIEVVDPDLRPLVSADAVAGQTDVVLRMP